MDLRGGKFLVIGGGGFIGSHIADELVKSDAAEIVIYDNFSRGTRENLLDACRDPRVKVFPLGGDITQTDILYEADERDRRRLSFGGALASPLS